MNHGMAPSAAALEAFGLSGTPTVLGGGQGESFLLKDTCTERLIVLKPTRDIEGTEFLCNLQARLLALKPEAYRIAEPLVLKSALTAPVTLLPQINHLYYTAVDSSNPDATAWTATFYLPGAGDPTVNAPELLLASRALHADLRALVPTPPPCIASRVDRWAWGDRYGWSEVVTSAIPDIDPKFVEGTLRPWLARLEVLLRRLEAQSAVKSEEDEVTRAQFIHGDLSGNLLFHSNLPPAIIDFSPYWRPVGYAEAIVASDLLLWKKGDMDLLRELGLLNSRGRLQMLVRATLFRLVTFAIDRDEGFTERNLHHMDADATISAIEELVDHMDAG